MKKNGSLFRESIKLFLYFIFQFSRFKVGWVYIILMQLADAIISLVIFSYGPRFKQFSGAIDKGRERLVLSQTPINATLSYTTTDILIGSTEIVQYVVYRWVNYFVSTLTYGVLPITYWLEIKSFRNDVDVFTGSNKNPKTVLTPQNLILQKRFNDSNNGIWSTIILLHVMEKALEVIDLHRIIKIKNSVLIIFFVMETTFTSISLIIMAEGSRMVSNYDMILFSYKRVEVLKR